MKFQTMLLFTYSVLVFFLTVVLGITFYSYTSRLFENNAASTYRLPSSRMSLHLDNLIRPMDFITTNLVSDYNFRTALTSLATVDRNNPQNPPLINEAVQTINFNLLTYSILKNFYSVVVISQAGDFFSSNFISRYITQYNLLFADVLLISLPPLILFIVFNRRIVAGIVAGAVKG